jgi:AcrR family transcriptional regulator
MLPLVPETTTASGWRRQRTQAARNELRILDSTRRLLQSDDAGTVDMRDIARAAGVGVGTIYRRFGDKGALLAAVIDADERELQDALLTGPPPLGPGPPAGERLQAFLVALAALTEDNLNVLLATNAASPGRMYVGAYGAWRLHVIHLLAELRPDLGDVDRGWYADALLAPLDPQTYAVQRRRLGMNADAIAANLRALALALALSSPPPA